MTYQLSDFTRDVTKAGCLHPESSSLLPLSSSSLRSTTIMPQKRKAINEDEGFDAADPSKRPRAEDFPGNVTHLILSY